MQTSTIKITAITLTILVSAYLKIIRPWQLYWGSRDDEIERSMPGDEIVVKPSFNATRAVTINAPAENIYPWIVQIGLNRAGWYSYDVLDNLARKSAERIMPEHQKIEVGDLIPMSPDGKQGIWVKEFRKNEWILWWDKAGGTTWAWGMYPDGEKGCRLITRVRVKYEWRSIAAIFNLLIEFFDYPMMRKCMLGIKERAEAIST
ncbi:MAG: hypothetical protein GY805_33675 [Chloroflexi bacterium]|nr:hypothetical protein [Chloroflexota bacterium]